ncbi:MAG: NYN domain-containing protein [bacterium]
MDIKIEKLLESLKDKKIGVFVDDSNLYHSYKKYGWRIDFGKFRNFLEKYCDLEFIHYHIAIPAKSDDVFRGTEIFLRKISPFVTPKKKLLKYTPVAGKFMKKADVDVEIVLDAVRTIDNLDAVIILSGDSDLLALKDYVVKDKSKTILFFAFEKNMAWELKYCWHLYLDDYRGEIGMDLEF